MNEDSNIKKAGSADSNIKKAQPKSGLSVRDTIAAQYSADLSGRNGATKQFDTFLELVNTEISSSMDRMTFSSGQGGAQIFGRGGNFAFSAPAAARRRPSPEESTEVKSRLDLIPQESDEHILRAPKIVRGVNDLDTDAVITNDPISLVADMWVVFKIDDVSVFPYAFTVAVVEEDDLYYSFDEDDDLTDAAIPIYKLTSEPVDSMSVVVREDVYATRFLNGEVLILSGRFVQVPDKPIGRFVPVIIPL